MSKHLSSLLNAIGFTLEEDVPTEITGISFDSRTTEPGHVFVGVQCERLKTNLEEAYAKGTRVFVIHLDDQKIAETLPEDIFIFVSHNPRQSLALLSKAFFGDYPKTLAAVTGTNGKSSTVSLLRQFWQSAGTEAACMGTLGIERYFGLDTSLNVPGLTSLDAGSFYKTLEYLGKSGAQAVAFEASSHGLDQNRLDGVSLDVAGFTNLTPEHLDYHADLESYFHAKARLFTEFSPKTSVINKDNVYGERLIGLLQDQPHLTYSTKSEADFRVTRLDIANGKMTIDVNFMGTEAKNITLNLYGLFQIENILCASAMAYATGVPLEHIISMLPKLHSIKGRMEYIGTTKSGAMAFVDYAHTPDAFENALKSIRHHAEGKIHVVFGCGGDRDPFKRPVMGRIAGELADIVYITDDNPRFEDPDAIRSQILEGNPQAIAIPDRAEAIKNAMQKLEKGDILIALGKGHQEEQLVKGRAYPFSDQEEIRKYVDVK